MKANTACGILALAIAALFIRQRPVAWPWRVLADILSLAVLCLGLLTIAEYLFHKDFGIDEMLFADPEAMMTGWPPGRSAPVSCVSLIFISLAILLDAFQSQRIRKLGQGMIVISWVISFQALVGYLSGVTYSFGSAFYTQIAIHTAVFFVLLSLGLLLCRPDEGIMAIVMKESVAGYVGRRLLLSAILVPPLVNALQLIGIQRGFYDADFGVLLRVIGNVVFFAYMAFKTSHLLQKSESERNETQEKLQEAVKVRDEFLSIASHELRTPITALKLQLQMSRRSLGQLENPLVTKLSRSLDICISQVKRLTSLIENLLDVSGIQYGKLTFSFEPCNISLLVSEMVAAFENQFLKAHCETELNLDDGVIASVDPLRFEQVVVNLLANATKYAPGTRVCMTLKDGENSFTFSVSDLGPGVPLEKQTSIFERFDRGTVSRNIGGLGLGLFISKQIVEGHGGTLRIESTLGQGSTFIVEIPKLR